MKPHRSVRQRLPPVWLLLGLPAILMTIALMAYRERALAMIDKATGAASTKLADLAGNLTTSLTTTLAAPDESIPATVWRQELAHDEYLAVCLFAKNQALDLVEWFQHHYYNMGIRRFYVMDDGSDPPLSTFMHQYGIPVESMDFLWHNDPTDVPAGAQHHLYDECGHTFGVNNTWIAFIDSDEFLDIPSGETLEEILNQLDMDPKIGALGINWQMHSSSHQLTRVASSRKTYLECISDGDDHMGESGNKHVKSIVRADAYLSPKNPHMFNLQPGRVTVGENLDVLDSYAFRQPVTRNRIALHHYVLKSFEDYADKVTRSAKDWSFWDFIEYQTPHVSCTHMLKYFPHRKNIPGLGEEV